ncbi:SRPBCC family protein [Mesonia sp.]|uniref:SRPBCC family protein n=1 Tax=Mesonia sp. TaxID=1960830 RepID=UPI001756ED4E|nr:SRPBCC family protein [Mesonia sp.]HIB37294.1 SRPBCC family protein [Mesonia sp.]HIO27220.1 SRPBCC family protein [Flavobacteriaceae bacterium]
MKYSTEIIIDQPREKVIEKLDSVENLKHWQRGLLKAEPLSGKLGAEGSKMELHYKMGKRELMMIETILKRELPNKFHATYDTKGVHNIQKNYFQEASANQTRWISESEFQFSSFPMKVMGFVMPGAFKKQSLKYMKDFKAFVEDGKSVLNE